ncbi:MAG: insulinase family protein [Melioribacteraceae bacterium]|nr:insulinase family protein [Melioribacteraceae bacterium]MCF8263539.1 insulinase family protein [Melioribacteraceae bacterium]MCF8413515.1 insulinase family protein [Melioribacteraceae bacterium]MCF8430665.1 insulinase family protein [Melioribacteraceae bacterium]
MKRLKIKSILFVALFCSTLLFAQKETPPPGGEPKDFKLPAKETYTLSNGMEVIKVHYGSVPKVSVRLVMRVGNLNEAENETWLSDITADLFSEGSENYSAEEIAQKAASMGGEVNVSTGMDQTTINGDVLKEFAPDLIGLISEMVQKPIFEVDAIERLKKNYSRNMSIQKSSAQNTAMEKFRQSLYPDHPYGRIYPTQEMIDSYDQAKVKEYYDKNFGAKRSQLYIVGVFDDSAVDEAIKNHFSGWKEGNDPLILIPENEPQKSVQLYDRPDAPQSTLYLGLPVVDPSHPDYIKLSVTNTLLGGSFGSRITSNIREDKGYTYSPRSQISSRYRDSYFVQIADVTTDVTADAMKEIFYEIEKLQNEKPLQEELEGIQNYIAGIFVLQNSSRGGITNQLAYTKMHGLSEDYLESYVKKIYAITPDDISEMTKKYIRPEDMTMVIVGDEKKVKNTLSTFGNIEVKE